MTYAQNVAGSLSVASSDSQPGDWGPSGLAVHSARRLVLPDPAGAEIKVSLAWVARCSLSTSRGRVTGPARSRGTCSFVPSSGLTGRVDRPVSGISGAFGSRYGATWPRDYGFDLLVGRFDDPAFDSYVHGCLLSRAPLRNSSMSLWGDSWPQQANVAAGSANRLAMISASSVRIQRSR